MVLLNFISVTFSKELMKQKARGVDFTWFRHHDESDFRLWNKLFCWLSLLSEFHVKQKQGMKITNFILIVFSRYIAKKVKFTSNT